MNCALPILLSFDYPWARCIVPLHSYRQARRLSYGYLFGQTQGLPLHIIDYYFLNAVRSTLVLLDTILF